MLRDIDGMTMVLVPAGCFTMGDNFSDVDEDKPAHEQCFDTPFWIDQTEVTNGHYGSAGNQTGADYPRDSLTWFDAKRHCDDRRARLPTEAEWEYAARGPDEFAYPWGDAFEPKMVNFCDRNCWLDDAMETANDGYVYSSPAGSYPGGASWVGALEMSGNVWEWVSSIFKPYPYNGTDGREATAGNEVRVVRGGSYLDDPFWVRSAFRNGLAPNQSTYLIGVRCAKDY